jgi:hypothetical protein
LLLRLAIGETQAQHVWEKARFGRERARSDDGGEIIGGEMTHELDQTAKER